MSAASFILPAAVVLLPACSRDGAGSEPGYEARVVPERLTVTALAGGNGVLDVIALTLRAGPRGTELYAALKNVGDVPACDAAMSFELLDGAQQSVLAGIGGLFIRHFYRLKDGSGTIAGCVGPGDVTMVAVTDLPSDIAIDEVGYVVYRCPYFALDVDPIAGLTIGHVTSVARGAGTAYTGSLVNELDVPVSNPSVTVFPMNRVGRPIGVAIGSGTNEIPPGGSWTFETDSVEAAADDYAAYPVGSFAD